MEVKIGATVLRFPYRKERWKNKATHRVYERFMLTWNDGAGAVRERRATLKQLHARAKEIGLKLINGETAMLQLTPADQASYLRARELSRPIGKPLELIVAAYAALFEKLPPGYTPEQAIEFFLENRPRGSVRKNIPDIVTEIFEKRTMSEHWKRVLKKMLERFAEKFTGPLTTLQSRDLDDWLDGLKDRGGRPLGLRSRKNYRDAVTQLITFARSRGYLATDWDVMKDVSDPEPPAVDVVLYTPEGLTFLLNFAETYDAGQKLVPLVATTAFAGVRHGEMSAEKIRLLDWQDFDWEAKEIYVGKGAAKTGRDRVVDMPANLAAWLQPYLRPKGRICRLANTGNALTRLRRKAAAAALEQAERVANEPQAEQLRAIARDLTGVDGRKKNALRKSFISYKKAITRDIAGVADQAGNSAGQIRKTYLRSDTRMKRSAERWFGIVPQRADVLPLFTWAKA